MTTLKIFRPCEELFLSLVKNTNFGVVLLNSPIKLTCIKLWEIWNLGKVRVLVDGGSESWKSWIDNSERQARQLNLPHLVTGDFDSITPDTLEKLKQFKEVQIIHTPNQNETDFTKALMQLRDYTHQNKIEVENIYVLTENCGRIDHFMANINALYKAENIIPGVSIFFLSVNSIAWLLKPGTYKISIPQELRENKNWCSLVPVGCAAVVTTSGLKWNLDKTKMEFGGLISTSNTYSDSSEVEVETDSYLLWSMSTRGLL